MSLNQIVKDAQEHLRSEGLDGWLIYDFHGSNPILWEILGYVSNVTRQCWFWIPSTGNPVLIVSYVDEGRFAELQIDTSIYLDRENMIGVLAKNLAGFARIAMEYSPNGDLPTVSKVDAGTFELVQKFGVEIFSSARTIQFATQRWSAKDLVSHCNAAEKLSKIVLDGFSFVEKCFSSGITEYQVAQFIRRRFIEEDLIWDDGPVVAVNENPADPHFQPTSTSSRNIEIGDWILIDLWARLSEDDAMFADITWVAYVGDKVPPEHQRVFDVVINARDIALTELEKSLKTGNVLKGWELDKVARDYVANLGYGDYFRHRLGHSLGQKVHGNAVNLDSWETIDTRPIVPGIGFTIEPGIYLPEFGVRSEIDVFLSDDGVSITTGVQREVYLIDANVGNK